MPRRLLSTVLQILAAAVLILGAVALIQRTGQRAEQDSLPPGWQIIRPPHEVSCLAFHYNELWSGGIDGITVIDRQSGNMLPLPTGAPDTGYVHDLLVTKSGTLFVAAESGLVVYDGQAWRCPSDQSSLQGRALCLLEVRPDEIWCGSDGGIYSFQDARINAIDLQGLTPHKIDVLYKDTAGSIWAGCNTAGHGLLLRYIDGRWTAPQSSEMLPHPCVNALVEDTAGTLWIGTGFAGMGGAASLVNDAWQPIATIAKLQSSKVRSLYADSVGRLWFGLEYDGVIVYDQGQWQKLEPNDGLAGREIKVVLEDLGSVYWLGTDRGLSRIVLP